MNPGLTDQCFDRAHHDRSNARGFPARTVGVDGRIVSQTQVPFDGNNEKAGIAGIELELVAVSVFN